jgi:hypothetical protein
MDSIIHIGLNSTKTGPVFDELKNKKIKTE